MLKDYELLQLFERCEFLEKAQTEIKGIRSSEPSRRVKSARGNVSGGYPSNKMGFTIQFESHENELPYIYQIEHNKDVLEYYDQPPFIKLSYLVLDKNGKEKHVGFNYTPDFFVIKTEEAGWVECKTEEELRHLAKDHPERYQWGDDDKWHCPPGEKYAQPFGFFFQVVSSASINQNFKRNVIYLDQYLCDENCSANQEAAKQVLHIVKEEPGITLQELRQRADKANSDDINILIAKEMLYFNLYTAALADPKHAWLYPDKDTTDAFSVMFQTSSHTPSMNAQTIKIAPETIVLWDNKPWKIVNLGETKVTLMSEDERQSVAELLYERLYGLINHGAMKSLKSDVQGTMEIGKARELLNGASREDLKVANYRHGVVMDVDQKEADAGDFAESERTVWNWVSMYRSALKLYGNGYVGLLPKTKDRGNRGRKIRADTLELIDEFIKKDFQNLKQMNKATVYGKFEEKCGENVPTVSYKTFIREIEKCAGYEQTKKRQGRKAAYVEKLWVWVLEYMSPRHGDRPWEIGHIDHTQLEIELVHPDTKKNLGRPWVTFLTDAYSRRILAIYLTFDKPSYRSCMMVMRECVRRHNRLPQIMIHDGGAEFHSIYFESLLARYSCTRKTRPGSEPRFGSVCERLFGSINTEFIHNLIGNTQIMKNVRQVTKDVNPKELAIWTFESFYRALCLWCYEFYDKREHPALGQSPSEAFASGVVMHGTREHTRIEYDDDFIKDTFPSTSKGTAKVQNAGVVKINNISYWTKVFDRSEVKKTRVAIRYDPFDASVAYAYVNKKWETCISDYRHDFKGRSEREIQIASEELRQRNRRHGQQFNITQKSLALFLRTPEAAEILLTQRLCDAEAKRVLDTINGVPIHEEGDNHSGLSTQAFNGERPASVLDMSTDTQKRTRNLKVYKDY